MKHTEWGIGFLLLFLTITKPELNLKMAISALCFMTGTQLPDYTSYFLKIYLKFKWERRISHEFLTWLLAFFLAWFLQEFIPLVELLVWLFGGAILHMGIDLFSGCEPPFFFQKPFIILSEAFHVRFGAKIQQWGSKYIVDNDSKTNADLAWFWFVQLSAVLWVVITLMIFVASTSNSVSGIP